jgi:hypothetical protein
MSGASGTSLPSLPVHSRPHQQDRTDRRSGATIRRISACGEHTPNGRFCAALSDRVRHRGKSARFCKVKMSYR